LKKKILNQFEEISGNMPDHTQPIANQLEQAIGIIRSHIKLLAESKIQADLSKNKIQEMEINVRKYQHEVDIRDKAIAELRLRLPATIERDILIKSVMGAPGADELSSNQTSIKAAQATIESLQVKTNLVSFSFV
jgi:centrosomal protein CEP290